MKYFVTAIDTDSGKTLVSSILCEALKADYWKPIQAGWPRDSETVKQLVSNSKTVIHPEAFALNTPASPHAAAKIDGLKITISSIKTPSTTNNLIIEGAGGVLAPLNDTESVAELILHQKADVILVSNLYLGSINHTLLTIEALHNRGIPIKGIVFNGEANTESERIILLRSKLPCLLHIDEEPVINRDIVLKYATLLLEKWN